MPPSAPTMTTKRPLGINKRPLGATLPQQRTTDLDDAGPSHLPEHVAREPLLRFSVHTNQTSWGEGDLPHRHRMLSPGTSSRLCARGQATCPLDLSFLVDKTGTLTTFPAETVVASMKSSTQSRGQRTTTGRSCSASVHMPVGMTGTRDPQSQGTVGSPGAQNGVVLPPGDFGNVWRCVWLSQQGRTPGI